MSKAVTAIGLLLAAVPLPGFAQDAVHRFQALEQQLFTAGTRLSRANAPFCADTAASSGFLIHDAASYGDPTAIRTALGLVGDIGVQAVADDVSGLAPNDTVLAIGGTDVAESWPATDPAWKRAELLRSEMESRLASGPLSLTVANADGETRIVTVEGQSACASRFEVLDGSDDAWADGERVAMGRKWPAFAYDADAFAASVAHELAHNIQRHVQRLDRVNRRRALVRISERDADRMMPWLLYNAGYDPAGAVRWMSQWGTRFIWLNRKRTHDAWDERVAAIEAETTRMDALIAQHGWTPGEADWRTHFEPELDAPLAAAQKD